MTLPVTALTAAICAIMILLTAIATVRQRLRGAIAFGEGENNRSLVAAMRSHGNLTEAHHWVLTGVAVMFLAARALHIVGLHAEHKPGKPPLARSLGVIGTWVSMAILIVWIFYMVLTVNA